MRDDGKPYYVVQARYGAEWSNEATCSSLSEAEAERNWMVEHNPSLAFRIVRRVTITVEAEIRSGE